METTIDQLTLENDEGRKVVSFRLTCYGNNVALVVAYQLLDHAAFGSLPEPFMYSPEEWHGIGTGFPLCMRISEEGPGALMQVKYNGQYARPRMTERDALLCLPVILGEKGFVVGRRREMLRQWIERVA